MRRTDCELMTLTFDLGGHRDCRSYAFKCKFRSVVSTGQTYHV